MADSKKRQITETNIKKMGYDQVRRRNRVNIGVAFQRWRELNQREGLESDAKVVFFFLIGE